MSELHAIQCTVCLQICRGEVLSDIKAAHYAASAKDCLRRGNIEGHLYAWRWAKP